MIIYYYFISEMIDKDIYIYIYIYNNNNNNNNNNNYSNIIAY
jgi:hypothetical protein